jgi:hypothetical protein
MKMAFLMGVALAALSACSGASGIGVRNAHGLVYHGARASTVLYGGADESRVRGDTWEWDGVSWRFVTAEGPPPRTFPAMAYDAARERIVLFGGNAVLFGSAPDPATFFSDTWLFESGRWRELTTPGPGARAEAAMAYDEARDRVVLFGGYRLDDEAETTRLGDTWEWDGSSWREVRVVGPSARNGASLAYSPAHRGVILFGGNGPSAETWRFDGTAWEPLEPAPEGRFNAATAFDGTNGCVLRFGGWNGSEREGDTWLFAGSWRRLEVTGPPPRNHAAMAFDAPRRRLVLFGGHDGEMVFGDTWEWNGERWSLALAGEASKRVENGH